MKNIILVGMPGCGKSTVGVILAKTLGAHFVDTDIIIQEQEGKLLQEIMDEKGVPYLLEAEERAILSTSCHNSIIATGGSAVFSSLAINHLKKDGVVVYLQLPLRIIKKRLTNLATRGVAGASDMTLEDIYNIRTPLYQSCADVVIACSKKSIEVVVDEICGKIANAN